MPHIVFSTRLSELRRDKGISQKLAAVNLGISQALLSHYEKGVRECGLDFVVKAAEYYGVTTDYLLGMTESKFGLPSPAAIESESEGDTTGIGLRMENVFKTATYIAEKICVEDLEYGDKLKWLYAIGMYKVILAGVESNRLPPNWASTMRHQHDPLYNDLTSAVYRRLFERSPSSISPISRNIDSVAPAYILKLVEEVERYIDSNIIRYLSNLNI